jgi:hypothetical protein
MKNKTDSIIGNKITTAMNSVDLRTVFHGVLFGCINAIMCIPVMISFTTIIFRDEAFKEFLPSLVKLVLFSCMIHQICFTTFSGLTFAVVSCICMYVYILIHTCIYTYI